MACGRQTTLNHAVSRIGIVRVLEILTLHRHVVRNAPMRVFNRRVWRVAHAWCDQIFLQETTLLR